MSLEAKSEGVTGAQKGNSENDKMRLESKTSAKLNILGRDATRCTVRTWSTWYNLISIYLSLTTITCGLHVS